VSTQQEEFVAAHSANARSQDGGGAGSFNVPTCNAQAKTDTGEMKSTIQGQLFLEVLQSFGEARLAATGTSMLSAIWPGDVLEVHRWNAAQISPGEVVLFARDGRFFAHRVVEKLGQRERTLLVTRGDRLRTPDPPVSPEELLGRVTAVMHAGRRRELHLTPWNRVASWALCKSELLTRMAVRLSAFLSDLSVVTGPLLAPLIPGGQTSEQRGTEREPPRAPY